MKLPDHDISQNHLLANVCPVYRDMSENELEPYPGWKWGAFYKTLIIECREWQPWAIEKLVKLSKVQLKAEQNFCL